MTVRSADPWALLLLAPMAALVASTIFTLTSAVSAARSRRRVCAVLVSASAAGFGVWTINFFQAPRFDGGAWLLLPLGIAIAGQTCALLFTARSEPDTTSTMGSAFSLAAGAEATRFAMSETLTTQGGLREWAWTGGGFAFAFAAYFAALSIWVNPHRNSPPWAGSLRCLAVLLGAAAILSSNAQSVLEATLNFSVAPMTPERLLGLSAAILGCAVLAVAQTVASCQAKLSERARRNARELDEVHGRLQYLATHDSLTGLPNRQRFKDRLAKAIDDTHRPARAIAIAILDFDHFRTLNHSLGHGVGDQALIEIARRISATVAKTATVARWGDDEFAILIDDVAAHLEAQAVARAVRESFEEPLRFNGVEVRVCSTMGISLWPDDGRNSDDLLARAEVALNIAKGSAGERALFFVPGMTDSMQERLALENDLRRALASHEFELFYQPQISVRTGKIAAVEALLRWPHPNKGWIGPNSFISLAEETGLIIPLGEWVLHEACRQARIWQTEFGVTFPVAVNLSATQFRHQNILQMVDRALTSAGLHPSALEIELTESALMTDPEESAGVLKQLRRMGISVAIDDFGTGYSSLSYLRRFPIDKLKIDRSFIRELTISRTDESIVQAIVSLARSVGLKVVAEGIESMEQLTLVTRLECDQWQGYHCCPPQSAERFQAMLADRTETRTGIVAALAALVTRTGDT